MNHWETKGEKWCATCQKTNHSWKDCWMNPNRQQPGQKGKGGKGSGKWRENSAGPSQNPLWRNRSTSQNSNRSAQSNAANFIAWCRNFQNRKCHLGGQCRFTHNPNRKMNSRPSTPRGNRNQQYMYPMVQQDQTSQNQQVPLPPQPFNNEPQRVEITLLHSHPTA